MIDVSIAEQRLRLVQAGELIADYQVSTAKNGPGERKGSYCTPTGWHRIRAKIGAGLPINSVFKLGARPARFTVRICLDNIRSAIGF